MPQPVQGGQQGRVYTFRDITSDIQNQADLRLAARVFESSLDAVFIADRRNAILRINPASMSNFQDIRRRGVIGQSVTTLFAKGKGRSAFLSEVQWKRERDSGGRAASAPARRR